MWCSSLEWQVSDCIGFISETVPNLSNLLAKDINSPCSKPSSIHRLAHNRVSNIPLDHIQTDISGTQSQWQQFHHENESVGKEYCRVLRKSDGNCRGVCRTPGQRGCTLWHESFGGWSWRMSNGMSLSLLTPQKKVLEHVSWYKKLKNSTRFNK